MPDDLSVKYPARAYTAILKHVQKKFGIENHHLPGYMWIAWRRRIKEMFDLDATVVEIIGAIDEASIKDKWPIKTAFWHRVRDVVLLHRRDRPKITIVDKGPTSLGAIFDDQKDRFSYPQKG